MIPSSEEQQAGKAVDNAGRILIVDDVEDNRAILARRFLRLGFQIEEASSAMEALQKIQQSAFDVVLLDVMMPEVSGIEALTIMRKTYDQTALPVIMVTAKTQSADVVEALTAGANDYVTKPIDFPVALARVNVQVQRKRAAERVEAVTSELVRVNAELESRVVERTAMLQALNNQLRAEVTERERSEAQTKYAALHDTLTGLPNRLQFRHKLEDHLVNAPDPNAKGALLFIDLDGFKVVNDKFGHAAGDKVLQQVANRLRGLIEAPNIPARLGGDEFAVLFPQSISDHELREIGARIIQMICMPCRIDDNEATVGASIGVTLLGEIDVDPGTILHRADVAMYQAKAGGRGTVVFYDRAMDRELERRHLLETDLRLAVSSGAFQLHYQPLVALSDQSIVGFEALLRWRHPTRGMVSPGDFIPLSEELGLISTIGEWVIRTACREAASWPEPIKVAVNVSPLQFKSGNLVATVVSALAQSQLAPSRLELEITETVLVDRSSNNMKVLGQLREIGVRLSIDDFGTGYSSLQYLRNFKFDKIKIDRSFVRDIVGDKNCQAIVRAIGDIALKMGVRTTAEGVENSDQLDYLASEHYTEGQGFLFGEAMPASRIREMFATQPKLLRATG
jgi:diguanylate cyclase (GGDEF)-like protein